MKNKRSAAIRKLSHALSHIHEQKMTLGYSNQEQEQWKALHEAERILDKSLFSILMSV